MSIETYFLAMENDSMHVLSEPVILSGSGGGSRGLDIRVYKCREWFVASNRFAYVSNASARPNSGRNDFAPLRRIHQCSRLAITR